MISTSAYKVGELVLVDWQDSVGLGDGWCDTDAMLDRVELEAESGMSIRSIGFVFSSGSNHIALHSHITTNNTRNVMLIPQRAIREIRRIEL